LVPLTNEISEDCDRIALNLAHYQIELENVQSALASLNIRYCRLIHAKAVG